MMKQPVRTNLSDFIKTKMGSQLVIPVYQRNYTWSSEKETKRYMDDIADLLAGKTQNHFLGILIYKESRSSGIFHEVQIIDGQQRLTTSFLFLLALKHASEEKKEKDAAGMIDDYYLYNGHNEGERKLRLKPKVSDDDVYAKLVYGSEKDLSHEEKESNVYRNYEYISRRIQELSAKHKTAEILGCLEKIDILAFPLSDEDNAQQIFESINSYGEPLTSADLIRNYILMNDTDEVQERNYHLYWQPLEKQLPENGKLEEFFRYYLAAKNYSLLARRDIYEGFKAWWSACGQDSTARMSEINRYCRYYCTIYEGKAEELSVEKTLKDFRRNGSRIPAPFLMEMYHLYDEKKISAEDFNAQVRLIDSYLTRRALCGIDNSSLSRYFPQLLRSVLRSWNGHGNIHEATRLYLINYNRGKPYAMPSDQTLRSRLKEVNAYSLMCIRPVLERIEHYQATAEVDTSDLNIEHIMPQHPNAWWKKNSGAKDDEEYTFYAGLIGNLTLCAQYDNTRMGNEDFAFKKKVLSSTLHIRMNTELLQKKTWTVQDILKRCEELAGIIIRIYPYEGVKKPSRTMDDDILVLNTPTVNARALYHNAQSVEILAGTTMKPYSQKEMKNMRMLYLKLLDSGTLEEGEDGQIEFVKNYRFHDLNTAAKFLMHRGGDNAGSWTRENGEAFGKLQNDSSENVQKARPEKKAGLSVDQKKKQPAGKVKKRAAAGNGTQRKQNSARKQKAPVQKGKQSRKNSRPNPKRRETMAMKMHMVPQKGSSSKNEKQDAGTGILTNLSAYKH